MKIGIVSSFGEKLCGLKFYAERLASALMKYGVEVKKIPTDNRSLLYGHYLKNIVKNMDVDVLEIEHEFGLFRAFFWFSGVGIIPFYIPRTPVKTITTVHTFMDIHSLENLFQQSPFLLNKSKLYRKLKAFIKMKVSFEPVLKRSDVIIVHIKKQKEILGKYGLKNVIYMPHPTPSVQIPDIREEYDLLSFGFLTRDEQFDKIFPIVKELGLKYLIHVSKCNDYEWLNYLKKIAPSNVEFIEGFIPNIFELIAKARAVIIPPCDHNRNPSGVFHDAISVGKPVIAPRIGEFADFKDYILTYSSLDELKENLKALQKDELRMRYRQKSLELASKTSYDRIAKLRIRLYKQLILKN